METFKQVLAFPLFATVAWLAWVLGAQAGNDAVLALLVGLVLIAIGGVDVRALGALARASWRTAVAALFAVARRLCVAWPGRAALAAPARRAVAKRRRAAVAGVVARRRSPSSPPQGQPVFVDFTAAWCVTCQVNKRVALNNAERGRRVRARAASCRCKADWTGSDPRITAALAALGRNAIPVYALYLPGEAAAAPAARSAHARRWCSPRSRSCPRSKPRRPRSPNADLTKGVLP